MGISQIGDIKGNREESIASIASTDIQMDWHYLYAGHISREEINHYTPWPEWQYVRLACKNQPLEEKYALLMEYAYTRTREDKQDRELAKEEYIARELEKIYPGRAAREMGRSQATCSVGATAGDCERVLLEKMYDRADAVYDAEEWPRSIEELPRYKQVQLTNYTTALSRGGLIKKGDYL